MRIWVVMHLDYYDKRSKEAEGMKLWFLKAFICIVKTGFDHLFLAITGNLVLLFGATCQVKSYLLCLVGL